MKIMMTATTYSWGLLATFTVCTTLQAQDWTRFRGPNGAGHSDATTIPVTWAEKDYNWKVALPGSGHSSPVLWGDKIFVTSSMGPGGGMILLCLDAKDGTQLWRRDLAFPPVTLHRFNSFASASAAVDKDRVYVSWTAPESYTVTALDHAGETVWERDLGPFKSQHGGGVSPMLYENMVIVPNEQLGPSSILALDTATGRTIWQTPRNNVLTAYSTPCVFQPAEGEPQLIFNSRAHGIYGVDPKTGTVLWEYEAAFDKRSVSSPVLASGVIIGSCGSGAGGNYVVAVKPPASPGQKPELAYEVRRSAPYVPTSVAVGDLLYLWSDGGIVTCIHAPTGEERWRERVGGDFFGSPICVGNRIYCISTTGEVVVLEAGDSFKVLGRNPLNELSHATPAVSNGRMYLRTEKHLISLGGRSS